MPFNLDRFNVDNLKKELQPSALKERANNLNDRYSSVSSDKTGYVRGQSYRPTPSSTSSSAALSKPPPPPPPAARKPALPSRYATNHAAAAPPPALPGRAADSRTSGTAHKSPGVTENEKIDWTNLSQQDKDRFYSLMDGFFTSTRTVGSALQTDSRANITAPPLAPAPKPSRANVAKPAALDEPPPPPLWARPSTSNNASSASTSTRTDEMSYPASCQTTSHAHDVAIYFSHQETWSEAWFTTEDPLPPVLRGRSDMTWTCSWRTQGSAKTLIGAAMFSDLSVLWWKVDWDTRQEHRSGFASQVQKEARYLDRPDPFDADNLWYACSTYGEQVAGFAEQAEARGLPIGHGECWDLASEALASVKDLPPPVPSIARTHGHLLFSGSANGKNYKADQKGRWRGSDTNIRRGDIVEWRKVRLGKADGSGWSDLGNPDHTAVIVNTYLSSDPQAKQTPKDGDSMAPWEVGVLEVIEQSKGKKPARAEYDLANMESGEVWIYRPVGLQDYLGIDKLSPDWEQGSSRGAIQYVR